MTDVWSWGGGLGIYCFHAEEPRWEATLRTTQKEGPNKGRKFFVCQEGQDGENCGFFLWEDEVRLLHSYSPNSEKQEN